MIRALYMRGDETKIIKIHLGRVVNMNRRPFREVHDQLTQEGWIYVPLNDFRLTLC